MTEIFSLWLRQDGLRLFHTRVGNLDSSTETATATASNTIDSQQQQQQRNQSHRRQRRFGCNMSYRGASAAIPRSDQLAPRCQASLS